MIRKDDLTMVDIEKLKKQAEDAKKNYEIIQERLKKAIQDEEDRKKAQLALEKENRHKEVEEAHDTYYSLLKAYINDYGSYQTISSTENDDWFPNKFWKSFF